MLQYRRRRADAAGDSIFSRELDLHPNRGHAAATAVQLALGMTQRGSPLSGSARGSLNCLRRALLVFLVCASAKAQICQPSDLRVVVKDSQEGLI